MVVEFHLAAAMGYTITGPGYPIVEPRLYRIGEQGVVLFFLISGFCLAWPSIERARTAGSTTFDTLGYAAKRIARIMPAYLVALLLSSWVFYSGILPNTGGGTSLGQALENTLLQAFFLDGQVTWTNGSFWTLPIEFRWYFYFPVLLVVWMRSPRAFALIAAGAIIAGFFTTAQNADLAALPAFMLGICAAYVVAHDLEIPRWPLLVLCGAILATAPYLISRLGWSLIFLCLIVAVARIGWMRALFSSSALRAVGVASYSIYLVHQPALELAVYYTRALGTPSALACGTAAALGTGFAFWFLVERPLMSGRLHGSILSQLRRQLLRAFLFLEIPLLLRLVSNDRRLRRESEGAIS